jgi:fructokinase
MILVCGEALVDVLVTPDRGPDAVKARCGGAPFNVAVGLARLDVPAAFLGGISTDPVGAKLLAVLQDEGVETRFVRQSDAPSMLALAGVAADGSATYSFPVRRGADKLLPDPATILAEKAKFGCAVFSSYLAFHEETAATFRDLARALNPGTVICLDPNVRLALLPDPARWKAGLEAFLPNVDILKISDEDIRNTYGPDASPVALADEWLKRGGATVVVTRGAEGASVYTHGNSEIAVAAPSVDVVDTVGAGDSFLSGFLASFHHAGRLNREGLHDLLQLRLATDFAVAAAAISCQRHGADLPRLKEFPARQTIRR